MANLTQVVAILFLLSYLQRSWAAPFSANSITVVRKGVNYFLREYSFNGTFLQDIDLPAGLASATVVPRADSAGTTISVSLWGSSSPYTGYLYTYNSRGQNVDVTSMLNSGTQITPDGIFEGQDVWLLSQYSMHYCPRGSASSCSANLLSATLSGANSVKYAQLMGTRVYLLIGGKLFYADPILKTGSGGVTEITGLIPTVTFFYFHSSDVIYAANVDTLVKFTLSGSEITKLYEVVVERAGIYGTVLNCYSMDVDGVRYVYTVNRDPTTSTKAKLQRFTDSGTAFVDPIMIENATFATLYGVGPSAKPTCSDGYKNQDESDTDCGGTACNGCANDQTCSVDNDCASGYCTSTKTCATPTCTDDVKNQDESDVDCGGVCDGCVIGQMCTENTDCLGDACAAKLCVASCTDKIQNQGESDVDCGGPACSACLEGKICQQPADCASGFCHPHNNTCATPFCSDGFTNQDETDIDCGGAICSACANDLSCAKNSDCESNTCEGNVCVNAPVPVAVPLNAPVRGPVTEQSPQSSTPSTTQPDSSPIKQQVVSAGAVVEVFVVAIVVGFVALILL